MSIKYFPFFVSLLLTLNIIGQELKTTDSTFLESFADKIIIKANLSTETDTYYSFNDVDKSKLKITPNTNYRLFLSLDYQFIGASLGFSPKFFSTNRDDELKGESSFSDFQFRFFLGKWVQGIRYKKIKGYYVENTENFIDGWVKGRDPYIQISNLTNISWGMWTAYVLNPKFSIRNLTYQTEWQKKSAGSLMPTLFYDFNQYSFELLGSSSKEDLFNVKLALTYYYTFVIKENWFIAPKVAPAFGVKFSKTNSTINDVQNVERATYFTRFLEGGLQLGYSSKRIIFGGSFNYNANWYNSDKNTVVENDQVYGVIYFGYRFDTPKFIENSYNWLTKKVGQ
jgi:hypothetical protein